MTETLINENPVHKQAELFIRAKQHDYTADIPTHPHSLTELIELLHKAFSTDHVNIDYIQTIMNNFKGDLNECAPYINFKPNKYTRNLVDAGNGKFNLMLLCWAEGQGSSIHDHTDSNCFMKCLQGKLAETRYAWPTVDDEEIKSKKNDENNEKEVPMKILSRNELQEGQVSYINDSLGLHRVENPSHTDTTITLHVYIPPYAHCQTYDERTSRTNNCFVTFYSINGQLAVTD